MCYFPIIPNTNKNASNNAATMSIVKTEDSAEHYAEILQSYSRKRNNPSNLTREKLHSKTPKTAVPSTNDHLQSFSTANEKVSSRMPGQQFPVPNGKQSFDLKIKADQERKTVKKTSLPKKDQVLTKGKAKVSKKRKNKNKLSSGDQPCSKKPRQEVLGIAAVDTSHTDERVHLVRDFLYSLRVFAFGSSDSSMSNRALLDEGTLKKQRLERRIRKRLINRKSAQKKRVRDKSLVDTLSAERETLVTENKRLAGERETLSSMLRFVHDLKQSQPDSQALQQLQPAISAIEKMAPTSLTPSSSSWLTHEPSIVSRSTNAGSVADVSTSASLNSASSHESSRDSFAQSHSKRNHGVQALSCARALTNEMPCHLHTGGYNDAVSRKTFDAVASMATAAQPSLNALQNQATAGWAQLQHDQQVLQNALSFQKSKALETRNEQDIAFLLSQLKQKQQQHVSPTSSLSVEQFLRNSLSTDSRRMSLPDIMQYGSSNNHSRAEPSVFSLISNIQGLTHNQDTMIFNEMQSLKEAARRILPSMQPSSNSPNQCRTWSTNQQSLPLQPSRAELLQLLPQWQQQHFH